MACGVVRSGLALSPRLFDKPALGALEELVRAPAKIREVAALSLTHLERASAVGFESEELERLLTLHERLLGSKRGHGDEPLLWLEAARIWQGLASAEYRRSSTSARKCSKKAGTGCKGCASGDRRQRTARTSGGADRRRREQHGARSVEPHAWRAPKPCRNEGYLAHLTLARARRLSPAIPIWRSTF